MSRKGSCILLTNHDGRVHELLIWIKKAICLRFETIQTKMHNTLRILESFRKSALIGHTQRKVLEMMPTLAARIQPRDLFGLQVLPDLVKTNNTLLQLRGLAGIGDVGKEIRQNFAPKHFGITAQQNILSVMESNHLMALKFAGLPTTSLPPGLKATKAFIDNFNIKVPGVESNYSILNAFALHREVYEEIVNAIEQGISSETDIEEISNHDLIQRIQILTEAVNKLLAITTSGSKHVWINYAITILFFLYGFYKDQIANLEKQQDHAEIQDIKSKLDSLYQLVMVTGQDGSLRVTRCAVSLRLRPSKGSLRIITLAANTEVKIVNVYHKWALVMVLSEDQNTTPQYGWVMKKYLEQY
jgi:hypothetical protein